MAVRIRTRQTTRTGFSGNTAISMPDSKEYCQDRTGTYGMENPFAHEKTYIVGSLLTGWRAGIYRRDLPQGLSLGEVSNPEYDFGESEANAYSRMVAGTAPERPEWLLPEVIAEFKDIPRVLKYGLGLALWARDTGRILLKGTNSKGKAVSPEYLVRRYRPSVGAGISYSKKLAAANLTLRFGVAPFISDLTTVIGFTEAVQRRKQELDKLASGKRLTRKWKMGTWTKNDIFPNSTVCHIGPMVGDVRVNQFAKRWGVLHWSTTGRSVLPSTDDAKTRMFLGLTPGGLVYSAYQLLPWSWLVDYFSNVGDVMGSVAFAATYDVHGSIMTQSTQTRSHSAIVKIDKSTGTDLYLSPGSVERVRKQRFAMYGLPSVSFLGSQLNSSQLSILGSLAISRGLG